MYLGYITLIDIIILQVYALLCTCKLQVTLTYLTMHSGVNVKMKLNQQIFSFFLQKFEVRKVFQCEYHSIAILIPRKEGRRISILRSASPSSSHSKNIQNFIPCCFTGPKMFWAGQKILCQTKNLYTYCGSHKHFVPDKKIICVL